MDYEDEETWVPMSQYDQAFLVQSQQHNNKNNHKLKSHVNSPTTTSLDNDEDVIEALNQLSQLSDHQLLQPTTEYSISSFPIGSSSSSYSCSSSGMDYSHAGEDDDEHEREHHRHDNYYEESLNGDGEREKQGEQLTDDMFDPHYWLPEPVAKTYCDRGVRRLYEWQVDLLDRISKDHMTSQLNGSRSMRNLIYCAPTSGGKTLCTEILMVNRLISREKTRTGRIRKAIYVAPYISIVDEKVDDFTRNFGEDTIGLNTRAYHSNIGGPISVQEFEEVHIAVCTIEKANSMINQLIESGRLDEICLLVIDEIHMIMDVSRGYLLELLLSKLLYMKCDCQIIGMSATLPNVKDLAEWLDNAMLYITNFRPVPLQEYIKVDNNVYSSTSAVDVEICRQLPDALAQYNETKGNRSDSLLKNVYRKHDDHVSLLCQEIVNEDGQVLVFCPSKLECNKWAKLVSSVVKNNKRVDERNMLLHTLSRLPSTLDPDLKEVIPHGVAFHHAGLTTDERKEIEQAFRDKIINILCCTTTLCAGVNLPNRRSIFISLRLGRDNIDIVQYKQAAGRAGRAGLDPYGESFIIVNSADAKNKALSLIHSDFPELRSCLIAKPVCLTRALLEVIASGVVACEEAVFEFSKRTLLARMVTQEKLQELISDRISFLTSQNMIVKSPQNHQLRETKFGRGTFVSCLSPTEAQVAYRELEMALDGLVLRSDLHAIYFCTPITHNLTINIQLYKRRLTNLNDNDRKVAKALGVDSGFLFSLQGNSGHSVFSQDPINMDKNTFCHYRFYAALILSELADEKSIVDVSQQFDLPRGQIQSFQKTASTFANMITSMCYALGWANLASIFSNCCQRLQYGVRSELVEICMIPDMTVNRARILFNRGYDTISKIASARFEQVTHAFHSLIPHSNDTSEYLGKMKVEEKIAKQVVTYARQMMKSADAQSRETLVNLISDRPHRDAPIGVMSPSKNTQHRIAYCSPDKSFISQYTQRKSLGKQISTPSSRTNSSAKRKLVLTLTEHQPENPKKQKFDAIATRAAFSNITNETHSPDTPPPPPVTPATVEQKKPFSMVCSKPLQHNYEVPYHVEVLRGDNLQDDKVTIVRLFHELSSQRSIGFLVHSLEIKPCIIKQSVHKSKAQTKVSGISFCFPKINENGVELIDKVFYLKLGDPIDPILRNVISKFFQSRTDNRLFSFCIKEQWKVLYEHGIVIGSFHGFVDVQIADWILKPDEKKKNRDSLDVIYRSHMTNAMTSPTNQANLERQFRGVSEQCTMAIHATRLGIYLRTVMSNSNLLSPFDKLEMKLIPVLAIMEYNGFAFDSKVLPQIRDQVTERKKHIVREIERILEQKGILFSLKDLQSPKKVGEMLFIHLKLDCPTGTKRATDKESLLKLRKQYASDPDVSKIICHIQEFRSLSSLLSKQLSSFTSQHIVYNVDDQTEKIFASQVQIASETGRLAVINPNLQNIPHAITIEGMNGESININVRKGFVASDPTNYLLMSADYRQIECRMMAHLASDSTLINIMKEHKRDLFEEIACEFFSHGSVEDVTSEERDTVKTVFYGIMYGMGAKRLGESIKDMREKSSTIVDLKADYTDDARQYIETLMTRFPAIRNYTRKVVPEMLEQKGYVQTLSGRRRYLEDSKSKNPDDQASARRKALSTICQGSAADLIKIAMINIFHDLEKMNHKQEKPIATLILQIHDELIFEVRKDSVDMVALLVKKNMEDAAVTPIRGQYTVIPPLLVNTPVKLQIGPNWANLKEYHPPPTATE